MMQAIKRGIANWLGVRAGGSMTLENPANWFYEALGASKGLAGVNVSQTTALGISAYFACIRNIAQDIAKLPIDVLQRNGGQRTERDDHSVAKLLTVSPNPEMCAMDFRETLTAHALAYHGGFAEIVKTPTGEPSELWPLDPAHISVKKDESGEIVYEYHVEGRVIQFNESEIFRIHGLGFDGITSLIITQIGKESIGTALATMQFRGAFFGNGTTTSGIIEMPKPITDNALRHLRQSFADRHQGVERAWKPIILEEDAKWKPISTEPEKSQMIESMQFDVEEVCRWFRMPPHKVQHLLRATFSNIEEQELSYAGDALEPWAIKWEQEIRRKLFRENEANLVAKHNFNSILRTRASDRATFYSTLFTAGVLSINDIRAKEDMNPIEGGDEHYIQGAMARVGEDGTLEMASGPEMETEPEPMTDAEDAPTPQPEEPENSSKALEKLAKSHEPLLAGAYRSILRVELDKAKRAGKRGNVKEWAQEFYPKHKAHVIPTLFPVICAFRDSAKLFGVELRDIDGVVEQMAERHCAYSIAEIERAGEACMDDWKDRKVELGERRTRAERVARKELAMLVAELERAA